MPAVPYFPPALADAPDGVAVENPSCQRSCCRCRRSVSEQWGSVSGRDASSAPCAGIGLCSRDSRTQSFICLSIGTGDGFGNWGGIWHRKGRWEGDISGVAGGMAGNAGGIDRQSGSRWDELTGNSQSVYSFLE